MTNSIGIIETGSLALTAEILHRLLSYGKIELLNLEIPGESVITSFIFGEYSEIKKAIAIASEISESFNSFFNSKVISKPDDKLFDLLKFKKGQTVIPKKVASVKKTEKAESSITIDVGADKNRIQNSSEKDDNISKETKPLVPKNRNAHKSNKVESAKIVDGNLSREKLPVSLKISGDNPTIVRLKQEALGINLADEMKDSDVDKENVVESDYVASLSELKNYNVHQLRRYARSFDGFPIKGREISRANRRELLNYFKDLI
jgi:microcompartment protein CcmL/EutN